MGAYLRVRAINTGANHWLDRHRLGTRWSVPDDRFITDDLTRLEDRLVVPFDSRTTTWTSIAPGSGFVFEGLVKAPESPGPYSLRIGMVEEDVAWFSEIEVSALVVDAENLSACGETPTTRSANSQDVSYVGERGRCVDSAEAAKLPGLEELELVARSRRSDSN